MTDFGVPRFELGENPIKQTSLLPGLRHTLEDINSFSIPDEGLIRVSAKIIYSQGKKTQERQETLDYADIEENREDISVGIGGMKAHNRAHDAGDQRMIIETNELTPASFKSYEQSHRSEK